jgi:hypothetical protein
MGLRKLKFGESEHFYHLHRETLEERNYHHRVRIACICLEHGGWAVRPKFDGWASSHAGGYTRDSSWRGYVVRRNGYGIPSEADSVVRRHVREKPCRISLSGGLCTLHLRRTSGCGLRRLDSLGEAAKIIDAVLGPLHDRLFPRYVLRATRFRRTLIRSLDRRLSVLRPSPNAALSLGWPVGAGGNRSGHHRLLPPKHAALVRADLFCRSIHLLVRGGVCRVVPAIGRFHALPAAEAQRLFPAHFNS